MRVLVTGGAGFIGSHLTDRLLAEGHDVLVLDNLASGKRENLPAHPRLRLLEGDLAEPQVAEEAVRDQEVVFHLAAVASVQASLQEPLRTHRANLLTTVALAEAARRWRVGKVIFASSAAVYGDAEEVPITESCPPRPLSPYAIDKLACEHYLGHYHRQGWLDATAFRFFNVFGPRQDMSSPYSGVISRFIESVLSDRPVTIFGDGNQTRDFVYVGDLVEILVQSMLWERADELPLINVGRGEPASLLDVLEAIEGSLERPVPRRFEAPRRGDIRHSFADIGELRRRASGVSFTTLEDGLRRTYSNTERAPLQVSAG